jgi:hypothetical protein
MRVSLRSALNTWSLLLPGNMKMKELWELSFRLTKGRFPDFELQHRNARLPFSQDTIVDTITTDHPVFITPSDTKTTTDGKNDIEDMCLVKVYDNYFEQTIVSFWEPKTTTRSIGSAVFRYYRQKFTIKATTPIEDPFVFWTHMRSDGDGHVRGTILDGPWLPLSKYFNGTDSTGTLMEESCIEKSLDDDDDDDDDDDEDDSAGESSSRTFNRHEPLVFKIALGRPPTNLKKRDNYLSRLDVLKQMFDAFVNRMLAYGFQTHIGLITFGSKASIVQGITNAVENFRHKLNHMVARGDTAIWDSQSHLQPGRSTKLANIIPGLALAQDQIVHYAEKYPNAKLRIICISDGEDNKSKQNVVDIAKGLCREGIVVDSFCLGDACNDDLQTVSYLTGGYTFEPKTLEEAMAICELEPVLSTLERPDEPESDSDTESNVDDDAMSDYDEERNYRKSFRTNPNIMNFRMARYEVEVERVSRDIFPERKEHAQLDESFVELGTFAKHATQARTDNNLRLNRIHNEIRNSGAHLHPDYDIYICEPNMGLWKIVMQGKLDPR